MDYRILGPLEVRDGGRPVDLGTPKQRALLAVLLLHAGEVVPTDRLADLVWDGAPPARPEVSLRSYAANLRRVLPAGVLVHEQRGYRLAIDPGEVDAVRFERLVQRARSANPGDAEACVRLDEALDLWQGAALADVADQPFARAEAQRLEDQRLAAVELRCELALGSGADPAPVIAELERIVRDHPLREGARTLLMRALDAAGRTAEALASYRELQDHLAEELGLEPSPAVQALERALRSGAVPSPSGSVVRPDRGPLVGRDRELAVLDRAWRRGASGRGGVVLVRGDAGIGKTRLVEEAAARAADHGVVTVSVACPAAGDAPPFWPWAEVLRQLAGRLDLGPLLDARTLDVLELVPDLTADAGAAGIASPPPALAPDAARFQRYDAVATLLERVTEGRPVLVALDDLQWADAASLHLLAFLAGRIAAHPLVVVATQRTDEDGPDGTSPVLTTLTRGHAVERVDLQGLADDAVAVLAAEAGAGAEALPPDVVAAIVERAGGNPFFVTELLRLGRDDLLAAEVPSAVRDVVRHRLQRLAPETARVLAVAAVVGREVDPDLLCAVEGDPALDALDAGVARHLLDEDPVTGHFRFRHALVREVLADEVRGLRRARVHARLAHALGAASGAGTARLAEWSRHACAGVAADEALADVAVTATIEAASATTRELGYETAAELCERALRAVEGAAPPAAEAQLLVKLAEARRASGDPVASRSACIAAAARAREAGDAELLAAAALGLALPGAVIGMDFGVLDGERVELLEAALTQLPPDDSAVRVRVLAHLALALYLSDDRARREGAAADAVAMADRIGTPGLRAAALAARRSTLWGSVAVEERVAAATRLIELAESGGAPQTALEGHIARAIDVLEAGRIDDFRAEVAIIDERAAALHQPFYAWYGRILEATTATLEGRYEAAERAALAAVEVGGVALGRRAQWGQTGWRYVQSWDTGRLAAMEPALRALASTFPENVNVLAALAHVLAAAGAVDEAAAVAGAFLADPAATVPEDATWLFCLTLLTEVASGMGDTAAAARLADVLAPAAGRLVVAGSGVACCGAADRVRGLALLTAGRVDEAESALLAALEQNGAIGATPWRARTEGTLARLRLRAGDLGEGERLLHHAREAATRLGAAGVLAELDLVAAGAA